MYREAYGCAMGNEACFVEEETVKTRQRRDCFYFSNDAVMWCQNVRRHLLSIFCV